MPRSHLLPKHRVLLTVATALMLLASGACSAAPALAPLPTILPTALPAIEPTLTPVDIEALDPTECKLHLWHSLADEEETELRRLAAQFAADNPYDIQLRVEFHSPLRKEVLAAMDAGTPPDIIIARRGEVADYALAGAVVPLTRYIHSAKYGLSSLEQADQWPIILKAAHLSGSDDEPLGLLFNHHAVVMFYNVDWLDRLEFDEPPQNWEDFAEMCSAATDKKTDLWGYAFHADGGVLVNWIWGLGGVVIDHRNKQAALSDPEAIAALSLLQGFVKDGCADCTSESAADRESFGVGRTLFTFDSTRHLPEYTEAIVGGFEWSVAPMPHLTDEPIVNVEGSVVSILRTTPRQQLAAWLFVKWLSGPRSDLQWALATGALPMHRSSKYAPEMEAYFEQNPQYETACQLLTYAHLEPAVPKWPGVRALLADAAKAVCMESTSPRDVLAAADTAADYLLTAR